ncbi:hypothetical protein IX303_001846 [Porphyromonas levii]|nr:hypothetical protein [Porphyromonas levii]
MKDCLQSILFELHHKLHKVRVKRQLSRTIGDLSLSTSSWLISMICRLSLHNNIIHPLHRDIILIKGIALAIKVGSITINIPEMNSVLHIGNRFSTIIFTLLIPTSKHHIRTIIRSIHPITILHLAIPQVSLYFELSGLIISWSILGWLDIFKLIVDK